jgi:hypothetical protein
MGLSYRYGKAPHISRQRIKALIVQYGKITGFVAWWWWVGLRANADSIEVFVRGGVRGSHFGGPKGTTPPMVSSGEWTPGRVN